MNDTKNDIVLLKVSYNEETNNYNVTLPAGSSVSETAFCIAVVCKCLVRDKVIDKASTIMDFVAKYVDDPQYDEVEEKNDSNA